MRFFEVVLSGAALISAALAVTIDSYPTAGVEAGKTYTITYSPKDQPATFTLRRGLSTNLDTVGVIGTGTGGTFSWTVPSNLANAPNYALQVTQGSENNFSGQFGLTGGSGSLSSAIASASSAASAAASSAAASASSVISSLRASASAAVSSAAASATILPSAGSNSTISSATISRTATGTSRPTGTSSGLPQATGAASSFSSSPLALVFGAVAAFAYLA